MKKHCCEKTNKKWIIWLIAGITAVVGICVAVGAFLKKKASLIGESLDYDADLYDEEEIDSILSEEPITPVEVGVDSENEEEVK